IADPALDRVLSTVPSLRARGPWKLVRNPGAFPPAWVTRRVREVPHWGALYSALSSADLPDEALFLPEDRPAPMPPPMAQAAHVSSWDGKTAIVEHDGGCVLILRRTYYPGWFYQVDGGPALPVLKVSGGLQGVQLAGAGTSRVQLRYRPTGLRQASTVTLVALAAALIVIGSGWLNGRIDRNAANPAQ